MAVTKADLAASGFDPSFLDKVISDFGADYSLALQAIAEFQAKGFGIAWIVDMVQTLGPMFLQTAQDLLAMLGSAHPAVEKMLAHPAVKMVPTLAARPFLQWLIANLPLILSIIAPFLKPTPADPTPVLPPSV